MRILCILDKPTLLKSIKKASKENNFDIKTISPEDELDDYFDSYNPEVIIVQDDYEDVSIKFLIKMLKAYTAFNEGIKLLVVENSTDLEAMASFAKSHDLLMTEEESLESTLSTKVNALLNQVIAETPKAPEKEKHLSRRRRILYVSDNKFMHIIVKDACLDRGIDFIEAYDGKEALEKLKTSTPDLVLTDMDIPGLSGLDLCKSIKHSKTHSHIPVVIYSSYEKDQVLSTCNNAGADDYYEKKINPKDLIAKIEKLL